MTTKPDDSIKPKTFLRRWNQEKNSIYHNCRKDMSRLDEPVSFKKGELIQCRLSEVDPLNYFMVKYKGKWEDSWSRRFLDAT